MPELERGPRTAIFTFKGVSQSAVDDVIKQARQRFVRKGVSKVSDIPSEDGEGAIHRDVTLAADCTPQDGNSGCFVHQCRLEVQTRPLTVLGGFRASNCTRCPENKTR